MKSLGQYQEYVCAGLTQEAKDKRLLEAPEAMHKQIIDHVKTVDNLKECAKARGK